MWLFSLFSRHISQTQSFQQNRYFNFRALVALKMLVSLISRLVACSPRIVVDKQTDRQTDTQNDYCNPHCACAPRVNNKGTGKNAYIILAIPSLPLITHMRRRQSRFGCGWCQSCWWQCSSTSLQRHWHTSYCPE